MWQEPGTAEDERTGGRGDNLSLRYLLASPEGSGGYISFPVVTSCPIGTATLAAKPRQEEVVDRKLDNIIVISQNMPTAVRKLQWTLSTSKALSTWVGGGVGLGGGGGGETE